jgi:hypothetical protein
MSLSFLSRELHDKISRFQSFNSLRGTCLYLYTDIMRAAAAAGGGGVKNRESTDRLCH